MKNHLYRLWLFLLSALCFLSSVLSLAAAPAVVINDAMQCLVDGVNYGVPADAIANNPALAPAINLALRKYFDQVRADHAARADAAIAKAKADADVVVAKAAADALAAKTAADAATAKAASDVSPATAAVAAARAEAAAAKATADSESARAAAIAAAVQALPIALPAPVKAALQTEKEKRRAEALKQKAALEAELAK